jgi:hypothetical protein
LLESPGYPAESSGAQASLAGQAVNGLTLFFETHDTKQPYHEVMFQRLTWILAGILLAGSGSVSTAAENPTLAEIRTLLLPMREKPLEVPGRPDGTPALTDVKHKLRDWIESRLREFRDRDDVRAFAHELNTELYSAKLSCDWSARPSAKDCPDRGQPGYLGDIKLDFGEMLVVTTAVGIECRFDESAYVYFFSNSRWRRFWQSETNDYDEHRYVPLNFLSIQLSSRDYRNQAADPNERMLLVLARDPAHCESNWYNVYYRVWQLRIDRPEEKLLLDGGEMAFQRDWVDGIVEPREVLIEYTTKTTFTDFEPRRVVRHYVLKGGKLEREDPVALRPQDFADEWMRTEWAASSRWTSAGVNPISLERMHRKENFEGGEYSFTNYCEKRPEHWQVDLAWTTFDGKTMVDTKHMYFLVRWLPPYRFSMAGVNDRPWSGCTEKDPEADEERTLFPVHLH